MDNQDNTPDTQQNGWGTYEVVVGLLLLVTTCWLSWHFVLGGLISPAFAVCGVLAITAGYLGGALNLSWRRRRLRSVAYCTALGAALAGVYAYLL